MIYITFTSSTLSIWLMRMARKLCRNGLADDHLGEAIKYEEGMLDG